ncbi:hypothetical protein HT031_006223 [Scenedesmus sp. PABB004]|nr:hypothetical protein HT031_006223 [Scenedesmus sp. PABB004]
MQELIFCVPGLAWQPRDRGNDQFALVTTNRQGAFCVDICNSADCGDVHGNIIQYSCHYGPNQLWYWNSTADGFGGRLLRSVSSGRCVTACPEANTYCNFVGDVSTAPCNATDPTQRWAYKAPGSVP